MGTEKEPRNLRVSGTLTSIKTLAASSNVTVAGTFVPTGSVTASSGVNVAVTTVTSSGAVVPYGINAFDSTGTGVDNHTFSGAPVAGRIVRIVNSVQSGSSAINNVHTNSTAVVFFSTAGTDGQKIRLSSSGAYVELAGISTTKWLVTGRSGAGFAQTSSTSTT